MKTSTLTTKALFLVASSLLLTYAVSAQSKLPDGTVIYPDGHRQLPNGTVVYPPVYDKKAGILGTIFGGGNPRKKTLTGNIFGSIFGSKKKTTNGILNPSTGSILGSIFTSNSKGKPKSLPNGETVFPGSGRVKNYQASTAQKDQVFASASNEVSDVQVPSNQQRHAIKRAGL